MRVLGRSGVAGGSLGLRDDLADRIFVGCWQLLHHMASVVQILVATRELGMSAQAIGMCYVGMGVGTILASVYGKRVSEKFGPGPTIVAGIAVSAVGWIALSLAPASVFGQAGASPVLVATLRPETERNCPPARGGGEHLEVNARSVGTRTRFGRRDWRACVGKAKPRRPATTASVEPWQEARR